MPGFESVGGIGSELVPSLRRVVVGNTKCRGGVDSFKFSKFPDVIEDGKGKAHLTEERMGVGGIVNIQFTSG